MESGKQNAEERRMSVRELLTYYPALLRFQEQGDVLFIAASLGAERLLGELIHAGRNAAHAQPLHDIFLLLPHAHFRHRVFVVVAEQVQGAMHRQ
jgi:hypothetical protein